MTINNNIRALMEQITTSESKINVYQTDYHQREHKHDADLCIGQITIDHLKPDANPALVHYDLAINDYTTAIQLKPDLAAPYYCRGIVYGELNDRPHAIEDYNQAIRLDPLTP